MNVAELLGPTIAARGDRPALIEGSGTRTRVTTYRALDDAARRAASTLAARGVGAGDPVLLLDHPRMELYAALIATFRLGAVAMFVEVSAARGLLDAACRMMLPKAFVAAPRAHLLRLVSPALRRVAYKATTRALLRTDARHDAVTSRAAIDPALVTFTSGSTGQPKGAVRSHGVLRAQLDALRDLAAPAGTRELVSLPIVVLLNLALGVESVLPDADLRRPGAIDPAPVRRQVAEHAVTRLMVSPALLERLIEGDALGDVEEIVTGGGPVYPDIVARAGRRVISVYGSTEAEPIAHVASDATRDADRAAMTRGAGLLVGHVHPATTLRLIDGEIVVAGDHVVPGYVHGVGDAETKIHEGGRVWHRTGDRGRLDETGRLWLLGRAGSSFAIECAARALMPGRRVAAMGQVLVVEGDAPVDVAALAWARLERVAHVRRIPMDRRHNSKVDYGRLRQMVG